MKLRGYKTNEVWAIVEYFRDKLGDMTPGGYVIRGVVRGGKAEAEELAKQIREGYKESAPGTNFELEDEQPEKDPFVIVIGIIPILEYVKR